jgi:hypothetical protein
MTDSSAGQTSVVKTSKRQSSAYEKGVFAEKAVIGDFVDIVALFDAYSSGLYGFVPHGRIKRHILEGACFVVRVKGELAACAMGHPGQTLWNIMVKPEFRHMHLGTLLIGLAQPQRIRVKCRPHKGMSDRDREKFTDPTPFYERMGYVFDGWDYPKNYFCGVHQDTGKGKMIHVGEMRNVKIMRKLKAGEQAPEPDRTPAPRVKALDQMLGLRRPRVRS